MSEKCLLDQWRETAYSEQMDRVAITKFWNAYFQIENGIYEQLLNDPDTPVKGNVQELADKYEIDLLTMVGFLDGINDSLTEANPIETMEAQTEVNLIFDKEKLYKNMVDAKADWLYGLPQWDSIFDPDTKKRLYK